MKRRDFIKESAGAGSALTLGGALAAGAGPQSTSNRLFPPQSPLETPPLAADRLPDLAPARWIWYPSGRCLQNTFVLFRRALDLPRRLRPRHRLDLGRQPLSAGSQRPPHPMGPRALRSALARGRPPRPRRGPRRRSQRDRRHSPLLRPGRRHLAPRQARLLSSAWKSNAPTARATPSSPTPPGRRTSPAPGRPATTSAGTCARSRRSSTRGCIPTAGPHPPSRPTTTGSRPCRWIVRPPSRRSVPPTPTTSSILPACPSPAPCARAASRRCAKRSSPPVWPSPCGSIGNVPPRSTSSAARPTPSSHPHSLRLRPISGRPMARRTRRLARRGAHFRTAGADGRLALLHHRCARPAPPSS